MNDTPGSSEARFTAGEPDAGSRVDTFVQARDAYFSRSRAAALAREGRVTVNGRAVKPSAIVRSGDVVVVVVPPPSPLDLAPQDIPVGIVYEDAHLVVVDKPAGLTVHPAPGHPDGTLVNALLALVADLPASAAWSALASCTGWTRTPPDSLSSRRQTWRTAAFRAR